MSFLFPFKEEVLFKRKGFLMKEKYQIANMQTMGKKLRSDFTCSRETCFVLFET